MKTFYFTIVLALAAALSGCGSNSVWERQEFAFSVPTGPPAPVTGTNTVALSRVTVSPLFQRRSFTYRTAENTYELDPYAGFFVSPEHALAEPIRARLRHDGIFGLVIEPGSALTPSLIVEASVIELDGDFRDPSHPIAEIAIHFIVYESGPDGPGRVLLDKVCARRTALARRTAAALIASWDVDLREIMDELNSDYAKTHFNDRR